ncbi:MAG: translesion error-prone DNA polymerase V autoproteolytic subunit [Planctomycetota bacterium]|nr:translesion error-prone DNA polymerase V autoproteolytic subunit [Planctomycetota bacterium]
MSAPSRHQPSGIDVLGSAADRTPTSTTAPLFGARVEAGFPSPADDYIDRSLDLHAALVTHPAATFFVRARGYSMTGAGIHDGDLLVVDRSRTPTPGHVVIAAVDGELTIKRLRHGDHGLQLVPENDAYPPIDINEDTDARVWGVVTWTIHAP